MHRHKRRGSLLQRLLLLAFLSLPHSDNAIHVSSEEQAFVSDVNVTAILDALSENSDKRVRPNYGGPPVEVGVTLYLLSISSINEVDMDFTLDFYLRQYWTDPRLAYEKYPGIDTLPVGSDFIDKVWVPDTFFVNEKHSYFHTATTTNEFMRIHHSGSVIRSIRQTVTASCPMNLQYFPMDRQLCFLEIESCISNDLALPQFRVLGYRQRSKQINLTTGNYSRLVCELQFVRSMGYYLIQIYIPSALIVIISWVSFWINRDATPARVSLSVTTVLTMTTLMSSTNEALPKISYVKSIDVYLGTSFIMVFASLLEYATVGYLAKRIQLRKQKYLERMKKYDERKMHNRQFYPGQSSSRQATGRLRPSYRSAEVRFHVNDPGVTYANQCKCIRCTPSSVESALLQDEVYLRKLNSIMGVTPAEIDNLSRVVFPVAFVCFNIVYWLIYLNISDIIADGLILLKKELI